MRLSMLPTLVRERFGKRQLSREPEPEVMDAADNVQAFTEAGRMPGMIEAAHIFHAARMAQVLVGCRMVVDLGCGPATQLSRLAALLPETSFLGVDMSEGMLAQGHTLIRDRGLENVQLAMGDMTALNGISDDAADGVISTMTLHHLPDLDRLQSCFTEIDRILQPGGALYLVDFSRLKSLRSVLYIAYMERERMPHTFCLDYERSIRAAFLKSDFEQLVRQTLLSGVSVYTTGLIPLLVVVKTEDRPISDEVRARIRSMRTALGKHAGDLDLIRTMFRAGGLRNDPFA